MNISVAVGTSSELGRWNPIELVPASAQAAYVRVSDPSSLITALIITLAQSSVVSSQFAMLSVKLKPIGLDGNAGQLTDKTLIWYSSAN